MNRPRRYHNKIGQSAEELHCCIVRSLTGSERSRSAGTKMGHQMGMHLNATDRSNAIAIAIGLSARSRKLLGAGANF